METDTEKKKDMLSDVHKILRRIKWFMQVLYGHFLYMLKPSLDNELQEKDGENEHHKKCKPSTICHQTLFIQHLLLIPL